MENTNPQSDMFSDGRAMHPDRVTKYQRHSATSKASAAAIEVTAETLRGRVYRYLLSYPPGIGATDENIQDDLEMNPSSQRPRRVELVERGLVYDAGYTSKTKTGRAATVWCAR